MTVEQGFLVYWLVCGIIVTIVQLRNIEKLPDPPDDPEEARNYMLGRAIGDGIAVIFSFLLVPMWIILHLTDGGKHE